MNRVCTYCKQCLDLTKFYKTRQGFMTRCISCINKKNKINYMKRSEGVKRRYNNDDKSIAIHNLLLHYQLRAKKRKIEFSLSKDKFQNLIEKNCHYCGTVPSNKFCKKRKASDDLIYIYNGIDRKNPNVGYNEENCVTSCKDCNVAKLSKTEEEFKQWLEKTYKFLFT